MRQTEFFRDVLFSPPLILVMVYVMGMVSGGCGSKKTSGPLESTKTFQATTLPEAPAVANVQPTGNEILEAKSDTGAAQANVRTARVAVESGNAPAAVQPLKQGDDQLTSALLRLERAKDMNSALQGAINSMEDARKYREATLTADIQRLKDECKRVEESRDKQIAGLDKDKAKLTEEIVQLKNEAVQGTKELLTWIGGLLILAGIGSVVAMFMLGFTPGLKVGALCGTMGAACISVASILTQIVWWTKVVLGVGLIVAVGYGVWCLYKHVPPTKDAMNKDVA